VVISHAWIVCSVLTSCIPIEHLWTFEEGYCHPYAVWNANSVINIVTDFLIFCLPLPGIFSLRLPKRKKIGLCVVFTLGFGYVSGFLFLRRGRADLRGTGSICVISLVRLLLFLLNDFSDVTWESVTMTNLTCLEIDAGIVCACLPTLWPLLVRLFPTFFNDTQAGGDGNVGVEEGYVTQPTIGNIATRRPLDLLDSITSPTTSNSKSNGSDVEMVARSRQESGQE